MSNVSPTQITFFVKPEDEEHALYLVGESLAPTIFGVSDTQEEQVVWGTVFPLSYKERRVTLLLSTPVTPQMIHSITSLVITGLILGLVVRGEIDLGERVINNLG